MNPEFDIYEKIDRYLDGIMESGERKAFESEMLRDSDLKEQVEAQRIANLIVLDNGMMDLKAQMQRDMNSSSSSGSGISSATVAIIGAVVIGAGVAAFLFTSNPSSEKTSPEKNNNSGIKSGNSITSENPIVQTSPNSGAITKKDRSIPADNYVHDEIASDQNGTTIAPLSSSSEKEITPENNPVQNNITHNKCDDYTITARVDTYDPCPGSLGLIQISHVKNGQAPYRFSLQNQPFDKHGVYDNLELGSYTVTIKDVNGCTTSIQATIKRNNDCVTTTEPSPIPQQLRGGNYTFEPEVDREWIVPLSLQKNATLKIVSRSGATVFENKITYGSSFAWYGQNSGGVNVEAGYYVYTLQYEDGSIEKGTITILR